MFAEINFNELTNVEDSEHCKVGHFCETVYIQLSAVAEGPRDTVSTSVHIAATERNCTALSTYTVGHKRS